MLSRERSQSKGGNGKKNGKMELILSREHSKMELGGNWEAELTLPCETELLDWAKPNSYILILFLELTLHH